jgi:hypothetical protein
MTSGTPSHIAATPDGIEPVPVHSVASASPSRPRFGVEGVLRLFAITVPALYAMGRFYASSWWQGIGLPASLERYAFEDYLFLGFYAALGSVGEFYGGGVGWRILQAPILVAASVMFYLTVNNSMDWLARHARDAAADTAARPRLSWLRRFAQARLVKLPALSAAVALPLAAGLTTLFFFTLLPLVLADKAGARDAKKLTAKLRAGTDVGAFPVVQISPTGQLGTAARLVQCTPDWCIVFANRTFHALPKASILEAGASRLTSPLPPEEPGSTARHSSSPTPRAP